MALAEDLPKKFDVIVVGTGMPESILAAAFSRIGQSVLHVDRNDYYSGQWASFNLEGIDKWQKQVNGEESLQHPTVDLGSVLREGETTEQLSLVDDSYTNVKISYNIKDEVQIDDGKEKSVNNEGTVKDSESFLDPSTAKEENEDIGNVKTQVTSEQTSANSAEKDKTEDDEEESQDDGSKSSEQISETERREEGKEEKCTCWTEKALRKEWRRFNLDLAPKLLYCGGKLVELLITSDIAKYCEFKTVTRMLTLLNRKLEKVPCSRADVFSSKEISMLDKRMLMKFLTFCAEYDKHPEDYQDFTEKPFMEYLKHKKLSTNVCQFVQHAIAMVTDKSTTAEGLQKTQKFLLSLGRYGNTAFLWPLYGSGEMPQSFCRMSAVFGGTYCLRMSASQIILDSQNKCTGIINTEGKRIDCKWLIMEQSYAPQKYFQTSKKRQMCRGTLVTDKSILPSGDDSQLSLLQLPDPDNPDFPTTVLELPSTSMACPRSLYVVHLSKEEPSSDMDPEQALSHAVNSLFRQQDDMESEKPCVVWSLYFTQTFQDCIIPSDSKPDNVIIVSGPGIERDLDNTVIETRSIFERMMPEEEFLPRPPNPEDIIYIDEEGTSPNQNTDVNQSDFSSEKTDQSQSSPSEGNEKTDQSEHSSSEMSEKADQSDSLASEKCVESNQSNPSTSKQGDQTEVKDS